MKFKNAAALLAFHTIFFILGTALFILLFHTQLFKNVDVLFYRGIVLLLISCTVTTALLFLFKKSTSGHLWTYRDILLSLVLIFSLNLVFFTHIPVTADRSISVFILGYMNNNSDKTISSQDMANIFTGKYLYEYDAMTKRFNEQIVSGNIVENNNGFKITKRGQLIIKIYVFVAKLFDINNKIISP